MSTRLKIARIAVPAALIGLTLTFLIGAATAISTAASATSGDTETAGTFTIIGLMSLGCAASCGFLAKVSIYDARQIA